MNKVYIRIKTSHSIFNSTLLFYAMFWLIFFYTPAAPVEAADSPPITITLAFSDEEMEPYYKISKTNGQLQGLWQRLLYTLFTKQLGWQVNYIFRPWQRAQHEVKLGNADALLTTNTPERAQYTTSVPTPFYCFPLHLFTYKNHPRMDDLKKVETLEDIAALQLILASNIGNGWQKTNIEQRGIQTRWLTTDEQVVKFVAMERSDGVIDLPFSFSKLINNLNLQDTVVDTGVAFGPVYIHLMLGKNSPLIKRIDQIDKALKKLITDGTFTEIYRSSPQHGIAIGPECLCDEAVQRCAGN